MSPDNWTEYQRLVLSELERHSKALGEIEAELKKIDIAIAMLRVKSGVWGMLGGLIPVLIALIFEILSKK